ncbi:hypothetical protein C8R45DRAFT_1115647 [Mycena sanguinolenta]|nr:hypothetical protein C8R45DRAFT_1115647 [Mycena sanguinolenta]
MEDIAQPGETYTPPGTPALRSFSVPPGEATVNGGAENPITGDPTPPDARALVKTQKGKVKPPRHKKGEEKAVPGKESWVYGTKLTFFSGRKAEYLQAAQKSASGNKTAITVFYTKMTRLYAIKYGLWMADNENLAHDVEDPPDDAANEVVHEKAADGNEEQAKQFKYIRTRIGEWYRRTYSGLLKSDTTAFNELFTGVLAPKPMRGQLLHYYSRKCYDTRVKPKFEERMAAIKRRAEFTNEKIPGVLALQNTVTREVWESETLPFQNEIKSGWERDYQTAVKA